jgi:hypothetical protein
VRSFDAPRERPAPSAIVGRTSEGDVVSIEVRRMTLVVAVKANCDGCRVFLASDLSEFADVEVVFVSATPDDEFRGALHTVVVAPLTLAELEIRSAPFYVLIDPSTMHVVAEGSLFSPTQVAREIAPFTSP